MKTKFTSHLRHFILKRLFSDKEWVFHFMYHEKFDKVFLDEYLRARKYEREIDKNNIRRVFVFSYSRSGTHNFYARLHYLKNCFALYENIFRNPPIDPYQLSITPESIRPLYYLIGSAFMEQGLQDKSGKDLRYLIFLNNYYLKFPQPIPIESLRLEQDYVIFYMRNFLRVLYSQDKSSAKYGKPHFIMNKENFENSVQSHRKKMEEMVTWIERNKKPSLFISHEIFCSSSQSTMKSVFDFLEISEKERHGWDKPEAFFKRCYRTGEKPEMRDGRLWCPHRQKYILGRGGEYNPLLPVTIGRTMADDIKGWLTKEKLDFLQQYFGQRLIEFWINDQDFDYQQVNSQDIYNIIKDGLHDVHR